MQQPLTFGMTRTEPQNTFAHDNLQINQLAEDY